MYKVCSIFFALLAAATAAPNFTAEPVFNTAVVRTAHVPLVKSAVIAEPSHVEVFEPTLTQVGDVVENVPTAVSHQSSTVVHSKAARVAPIVAPAVRSYVAPAVHTYAAPLVEQQVVSAVPALRSVELGPAAAFVHANAPVQVRTYAAAPSVPLYRSYGFGYATPVVYASEFKKK